MKRGPSHGARGQRVQAQQAAGAEARPLALREPESGLEPAVRFWGSVGDVFALGEQV